MRPHPTAAYVPGPMERFLADDHARLEHLLGRGTRSGGAVIDDAAYAEFRAGLLRHIGMEEKILLPAARRANGGIELAIATRLRLEHGAIAALLVPTASPTVIAALRDILAHHNAIEEGSDGLYATCTRLLDGQAAALVDVLDAAPAVPVARHVDGPHIVEATRRALARAGYELASYEPDRR